MRQIGSSRRVELVLGRAEIETGLELEAFEPRDAGRVVAHRRGPVGPRHEGANLSGTATAVLEETEAGCREGCRRRQEDDDEENGEEPSIHGRASLSLGSAGLR